MLQHYHFLEGGRHRYCFYHPRPPDQVTTWMIAGSHDDCQALAAAPCLLVENVGLGPLLSLWQQLLWTMEEASLETWAREDL